MIDLFYARGYSIDWDKNEFDDRIEYILYLDKLKGTFSIDQESLKKDCDVEFTASTMTPNSKRKIIFKYVAKRRHIG